MSPELLRLKDALLTIAPAKRLALAYSGGLDSRTLAAAAKALGFDVTLLHAAGPQITGQETARAKRDAEALGLTFLAVPADSFAGQSVVRFERDRCYVCKKRLFTALLAAKPEGVPLIDGTNADDLGEWRPGLAALRELGVASPLAQAKLTKAQVRGIARELGLSDPDQPSKACLLTRFDYGAAVTREKLAFVARAEAALERLAPGLPARVREVAPDTWAIHVAAAAAEKLAIDDAALLASVKRELDVDSLTLSREAKLSGYFDRLHRL